jgi:transcriptional regulator with XRE-family HTH domain
MSAISVGQKIRKLRHQFGWSQGLVARKAGISQGYLSQLESDETSNPKLTTLLCLADLFQVPLDYFRPDADEQDSH